MLRKISILFSVFAALSLALAVATPSTSFAKNDNKQQNKQNKQIKQQNQQVKKQQQQNFKQKNVVVKKQVHVKYVHGQKYNGHIWYGYSGHRWRGVYYAYGVGPCWIYVDGVFFWNVLACPI